MRRRLRQTTIWSMLALSLALSAHAATVYEVRPGDSLWEISREYLRDGFRWSEIYQLNQDKIANPHVLEPGQKLVLPTPKAAPPQPLKVRPQASPTPSPDPEATPVPVPTTEAGTPLITDFAALTIPPDPWCEQ